MENNGSIRKNSVKRNFIYNVIYQVFVLIVPLVTTPYLSRVLLAEGIGQYSFTYSLVNYFVLIAALGFGVYAQREIAKHQGDKHKQSIIFFEILIVRFFSVSVSVITFATLCFSGVFQTYQTLMWWWIILIISQEFDITFLFQGNEQFGKIVFRNVFIKTVIIIMVFVLVKKPDDVWIYILCFEMGILLGNLSLWFYLPKYLTKVKVNELHPIKHIKPTLKLFIPTIATSIYTMVDKTLIGILIQDTYIDYEVHIVNGVEMTVEIVKKVSDLENGYYSQAEKLINLSLAIITALGTVMIPRNSYEYSQGHVDKVKDNIYTASRFVFFIGIPIMFGLVGAAPNILPWLLGEGYDRSVGLLQIFSSLTVIMGISNVLGLQFLVPYKMDNKYAIAIIFGAVLNIILNLVLIPFYWSYGAVIASVISELAITALMFFFVRKEISLFKILKMSIKYFIAGLIMLAAVYFTGQHLGPNIPNTCILVFEGIAIYFVMMLILHEKFTYLIINKIKTKLKKTSTPN